MRAYADCMAGLAATPAAYSRGLAYLLEDLGDPDLRAQLARQGMATRDELADLIRASVVAGGLSKNVKPAVLARTIEALLGGSLLVWGYCREGTAAAWLRKDLDALLAPYLTTKGKAAKKGRSPA